jgi:Tfp pilus assembly protein PilN
MIYLKTSIGVELRGEDMLLSSLQSNYSGSVFTHFMRIPGYRLRDTEDLRREINIFFRSHGLSRDNIVLGIPRKDIVLRYLDLPAEVEENLKQVVQYQVQSFEPTEEDRFYHDYALLHSNGSGKRLSVMLAMIRKTMLDDILQFLQTLGIRPVTVTCGSVGIANLLLQNRKELLNKTFILGDVGESTLETTAISQGALVYSRTVSKAAEDASWKELFLREADDAASQLRLGPEGTIEKIILAGEFSENACEEIKPVFPDCILIRDCIPVEIPGEIKPYVQGAASSLGLAYTGMVRRASIRLNLLPMERRIRQSWWAYVPAAVLGLIVIGLLCGLGFHKVAQNRILIRQLDQKIQSLRMPVAKAISYRTQSEQLDKRIKAIEELLNKRDLNLEVLRELTTRLPDDTYVVTYRYQDGNIQISGQSASASDLIPKLEKSPLLKEVSARGTIYKNQQTGKEQFTFDAKLER